MISMVPGTDRDWTVYKLKMWAAQGRAMFQYWNVTVEYLQKHFSIIRVSTAQELLKLDFQKDMRGQNGFK